MGVDAHDHENRDVVERAFNHFENGRGLATRYDELSLIYRGGAVLAAILAWLRGRGDAPYASAVRRVAASVPRRPSASADGEPGAA